MSDENTAILTPEMARKAITEYRLKDVEFKVANMTVTSNLQKYDIAAHLGISKTMVTRILNRPNVKAFIDDLRARSLANSFERTVAMNNAIIDRAGQALIQRFEPLDEDDVREIEEDTKALTPSERLAEKRRFAHWSTPVELDKIVNNAVNRQIKLDEIAASTQTESDDQLAERIRAKATKKSVERRTQSIELQKSGIDISTMFSASAFETGGSGMVIGFKDTETREEVIEVEVEETVEFEIERFTVKNKPKTSSTVIDLEEEEDDDEWE